MKTAAPNPCTDCPFRRTSLPGWLGEWSGPDELSAHVLAGNRYPCHLTMNSRSDYDDHLDSELIDDLILCDATQCRGSVMYKERATLERQGRIVIKQYFDILSPLSFKLHHESIKSK